CWGSGMSPQRAVRPRVLVIEDHPDGREGLRLFLRVCGYEVQVAADGPEGVERALAWRPDVVISDIGLPALAGYEVARRLPAALGGAVRVIALTAYGGAADRDRGLRAGFDEYLVKPADPDHLRLLLGGAA